MHQRELSVQGELHKDVCANECERWACLQGGMGKGMCVQEGAKHVKGGCACSRVCKKGMCVKGCKVVCVCVCKREPSV